MSSSQKDSILVVGAHPDDECLGAGGTISKHVEQGYSVDVLSLTGNDVRNKELAAACKKLGVRKVFPHSAEDFTIDKTSTNTVVEVLLQSRPRIVITHSLDDYNVNHSTCSKIVDEAVEWASHITLFPNAHRVERIYNMEINNLHTLPNVLVDISSVYDKALSALKEHKTQLPKADQFYLMLYDAKTKLRGVQAACERAEAFTIKFPKHAGPFYEENSVDTLM
ncbi:MAG: PIG-L deacetylase family protein [Candidatus Thorarchaeota archaeon]|jgi:LmbE family N-acetylglucosaminyl deacetylase